MHNDDHMTGRSNYDPNLGNEVRYREVGSGKILLVVAALIVVIGAILWFGSASDTGTTAPDATAPAALAPADQTDPTSAPAAPAPAPETSAPVTDQPAPAAPADPAAPAQQ